MSKFVFIISILIASTTMAAAATERYILRPGDTVEIFVWQDQAKSTRKVKILPDGRLTYPLAGHVAAAGLTLETLEKNLKKRLKKFYRGGVPITVSVSVVDMVDRVVYITGQVRQPGEVPLKGAQLTLFQAIALSGGFGTYAAKNRVQVRRVINGQEVSRTFNLKSLSDANSVESFYVRHGDLVIVPERGIFE